MQEAGGLGTDLLVVIIHAYGSRAAARMSVVEVIRHEFPGADLIVPELPLGLVSFADPNEVVANLLQEIDRNWENKTAKEGKSYNRIILVGASLGGLLARKLYVVACGESAAAPLEEVFSRSSKQLLRRGWSGKVERIILLAGMNRGWHISHHLSPHRALEWWLGVILLIFIARLRRLIRLPPRDPLIFTVRRGATFITQLRIQWIRMRHEQRARAPARLRTGSQGAGSSPGQALTVQLLGSIDDFVAPTDNVDLVAGGDFVYLDVPCSGHVSVNAMDGTREGLARREVFTRALTAPAEELMRDSLSPQDDPGTTEDADKQHVVFVVHGIRDEGYWTQKVARKVLMRARSDGRVGEFATETSTYGFFPMLPFLFSRRRREKVEWFMDQYAGVIARYPKAKLHYVGHSNGTYCLARALELYPSCRFERVVFAGSVVRRAFDWSRFMSGPNPQVGSVLNYVASADWVVAGFPRLFEFFRFGDLGSAGHNGFAQKDLPSLQGRLHEVTFVRGSHGAAIEERHWSSIAEYVYSGRPGQRDAERQNAAVKVIGLFPPLAMIAAATAALVGATIVAFVTYGAVQLASSLVVFPGHLEPDTMHSVALTLGTITGLTAVWKVLTKL